MASAKDECKDKDGMIIKHSDECEKCDRYPCRDYIRAMNAIICGEN